MPSDDIAVPGSLQIHHSLHSRIWAPAPSGAYPTRAAGTATGNLSRSRRPPSSHAGAGVIHVLLVEDNEISQKLLKKQLVRAGCSVATANDGVEAVEFLLKNVGGTGSMGNGSAPVELVLMGE